MALMVLDQFSSFVSGLESVQYMPKCIADDMKSECKVVMLFRFLEGCHREGCHTDSECKFVEGKS